MSAQPQRDAPLYMEFGNNTLLPALYGRHDAHLTRIEQRLGVRLSSRGNRMMIAGPAAQIQAAQAAILTLYQRLERGEPVGPGEVDGAVRMAGEGRLRTDPENPRLPLADLPSIRTRRGAIVARGGTQAGYMEAMAAHEMVFALGPAGTGKTYLAVAQAVAMLQSGRVERIVLSRPAVEAGERLGFLPGDLREKVDPYLRPLYDALYDMLPADQVMKRLSSNEIEIAPLAFMRGRTLSNAFVIMDEAQNTTPVQMKMFLTRLGEGSRMVVTGDLTQVDLPVGQKSGLRDALETLEGTSGIGVVRFRNADVVRHPLVGRIVDAYDARAAALKEATKDARTEGEAPRGRARRAETQGSDGTGN
jgi:phosphate starvation-inducible PhoH-like protein